ncbi:MAG: 4-hydroxy-tetrahydrodipicolinate reductase [Flavobacteriia bacterium]|nr:4-hydroxy-tetrahydrodipicolinate reductase [Flavobacteriia bacterium]
MKIALIGYGKMGKTIERLAVERGHEISAVFDSNNPFSHASRGCADVAIEFSRPDAVMKNIQLALENDMPLVVGTTSWQQHLQEVREKVDLYQGSLLYASNFSLGVAIYQALVKHLAQLLNQHPTYKLSLEEIHHTEKLDAPSGTAISIAETVIEHYSSLKAWELSENSNPEILPITALRIPGVPGTHTLKADSHIDSLHLSHVAHNRDGFALGAILSAEFLWNKRGIFTLQDVLKLT